MQAQAELQHIDVAETPPVPGLIFRGFRGPEDYPQMAVIIAESGKVDDSEWAPDPSDIASDYAHQLNCDLDRDMIFAQVGDETVGYGRIWWNDVINGPRLYTFFAHLLPQWRGQGIRRAMARWLMERAADIAAAHPAAKEKWLQAWAGESEAHWSGLLAACDFQIVRYGLEMKRSLLGDDLPDCPLPDGCEIRPGSKAEWRQIWEAAREAFRDHWGATEWTEESYLSWQGQTTFVPHRWRIAWYGDEVAGGVLNFIDARENERNDRLRGYTETIFVRRPFRGRGVAKALIAASFQVLKAEGMTEAALGVDAENLSGALHLYRKMGFRKEKQHMTFRKKLVS